MAASSEKAFRGRQNKGECGWYSRLAEVGNVHYLKVHDARANKGRHRGGYDLCHEGVALWDLEVVGQLQIVGEIQGMCRGHIAARGCAQSAANSPEDLVHTDRCGRLYVPEALEEVHSQGVAGLPPTADEFRENAARE